MKAPHKIREEVEVQTCKTDRTFGPLIAATKPVRNTVAKNMNGI